MYHGTSQWHFIEQVMACASPAPRCSGDLGAAAEAPRTREAGVARLGTAVAAVTRVRSRLYAAAVTARTRSARCGGGHQVGHGPLGGRHDVQRPHALLHRHAHQNLARRPPRTPPRVTTVRGRGPGTEARCADGAGQATSWASASVAGGATARSRARGTTPTAAEPQPPSSPAADACRRSCCSYSHRVAAPEKASRVP